MLALFKGHNGVYISLLSPENRNRHSFQNVAFSSYLEFQKMDKAHKRSDSESCTPSLEPRNAI
jgi:hypothetical protein